MGDLATDPQTHERTRRSEPDERPVRRGVRRRDDEPEVLVSPRLLNLIFSLIAQANGILEVCVHVATWHLFGVVAKTPLACPARVKPKRTKLMRNNYRYTIKRFGRFEYQKFGHLGLIPLFFLLFLSRGGQSCHVVSSWAFLGNCSRV